jgi:hypothetical protein
MAGLDADTIALLRARGILPPAPDPSAFNATLSGAGLQPPPQAAAIPPDPYALALTPLRQWYAPAANEGPVVN